MATIAIDVNDVVGMNAAVLRTLNDQFGEAVTKAFIGQYEKPKVRSDVGRTRPHLTAAQIADALEQGKAEAAKMSASVGGGRGNFTEDRHSFPGMTHEEVFADIMRIQAERAGATV